MTRRFRDPLPALTPSRPAQGLSRRDILRLVGVAGLAVPAGSAFLACAPGDSSTGPESGSGEESGSSIDGRLSSGVKAAPGLATPRFIETNGIRMGVYEQGDGVPVVFCHGFPELAYSWRHQIEAFSRAGYRTVAADQRGYGLTDRPKEIEAYTLVQLCGDMTGLLDALQIERAVFVGHDWGGGVVWMMPRLYPDRVLGVIGVNTPTSHPEHPREAAPGDSLIVPSERFYQTTFQPPGVAEAVLEKDVRRTFEFFMRRGGIWNVEAFKALAEDSPERRMDLLTLVEQGQPQGELILTAAELDYFVETFQATGFSGGLNWYRAARLPGLSEAVTSWDIEVPCLYVGAENDVILRPSSAVGMRNFISDFENQTIADCGHWTQQEKPAELNRITLDWLARHFPA